MANRWAIKNGNWSDPTTWDSGLGVPTTGDVVGANGYTVTIDQDVSVAEIKTTAVGSGAAGGGFTVNVTSGTRTITCSVGLTPGTSHCLQASISAGATLVINGTLYGGSTGLDNRYTVVATGSGTILVNGVGGVACLYGQYHYAVTLRVIGPSAVVNGDVVPGGGGANLSGIINAGNGNITITAANIVGPGGAGDAAAINNTSTGNVTITATMIRGGDVSPAIKNTNIGNITIAATTVIGGLSSSAYGISNNGTGNIIVNATTVAGKTAPAIYSTTNGSLRITGNCYADPAHAVYWSGSGSYCEINGDQYGGVSGAAQGKMAVVAYNQAWPASANYMVRVAESNGNGGYSGNTGYLYGAARGPFGHPAVGNVRYGTQYGPNNEFTGTCRVPAPQSVLYGVPVDDTTGTVTITSSDIASAVWGANRDDYKDAGTFGAVDEWASTVTVNDIADGIADKEVDTGVSVKKALEMLAAFMAGKVTASSSNGVTTYSYKKRDGTTVSFTSVCSEEDGTRATTGGLS